MTVVRGRLSASTAGNKKKNSILTHSHPRTVRPSVLPTNRQLPPVEFNKARGAEEKEKPQCGQTHSCIGPNVGPFSN